MMNPIVLHNFADDTPPAWATFYTSASSPNPITFTVKIPIGQKSYFDFGDGSEVLIIDGNGADQIIQKTYLSPVSGTKISIGFSDVSSLALFYCYGNQLTGSIPSFTGLTALSVFHCSSNQLTGSIPSLTGLTALFYFHCSSNQLTGSIPSFTGLTSLAFFYCSSNQLTGSIPSFTGLTSLFYFYCSSNQLTGSIPSLTGLTALSHLDCSSNQLTGFAGGMTGSTADLDVNLSSADLTESAVNLILADSVTEGLATGDTLNLSGGTSATPTGQGIIDQATLTTNGVTVIVN